MQMLQRNSNFGQVEFCFMFVDGSGPLQMHEQFTSTQISKCQFTDISNFKEFL